MKRFNLLQEILARSPASLGVGISLSPQKQRYLVCTPLEPEFIHQLADILNTYWKMIQGTDLLLIDCEGIDVITPLATEALIEGTCAFARNNSVPVIYQNAKHHFWRSIESIAAIQKLPVWVQKKGETTASLFGHLDEHLVKLLKLLDDSPSSASDLATSGHLKTSNVSCYLQELHKRGLVKRTKVTALERADKGVTRGWTFVYYSPKWMLNQNHAI